MADIQTFYRQSANQDHVIVAPYNYAAQGTAGSLPTGTQMALVAWHHMELCKKLSLAAARGFVNSYRIPTGQSAPPGYKGDAPEIGSPI